MMRMRHKRLVVAAAVAALVGTSVLIWPAATWLQGRELWANPAAEMDALYLVAGARDQNRRISSLVQFCKAREVSGSAIPPILLANDWEVRYEIPDHFDGVHLVDLARVKIPALLGLVLDDETVELHAVPGTFYGTAGEMAALAEYTRTHPELKRLGLTTSPYHVRRTVLRLRAHAAGSVEIMVTPPRPGLRDRNPVLVLAELMKIVRDALGLSNAPLISRRWWMERKGRAEG
jgi:hypothetical protein